MNKPWHSMPAHDVLKEFNTNSEKGLEELQIEHSRLQYGRNILPITPPPNAFLLFLQQFHNPVIYILLIAALLNVYLSDPLDSLVICFVVLLNTMIGFVQERKAAGALAALQALTAPTARVLRNSQIVTIDATELVCGDIIFAESGMRIPADARLISSTNLYTDESMLTGESFPVQKNALHCADATALPAEQYGMLFAGSVVLRGRGMAIITATGQHTCLGGISGSINSTTQPQSPLEMQIQYIGKQLSITISLIVVGLFIIGFIQGQPAQTMLLTAIGLAVSAIPEGLPVSVTIALAVGISRMAGHKAIIRKLAAVETLGSATVLCTDKTGTLTRNEMFLKSLKNNNAEYLFDGEGYKKSGSVTYTDDHKDDALENAALICWYCSETVLNDQGDSYNFTGDPTEAALMIGALKAGFTPGEWQSKIIMPFESESRMMISLIQKQDGTKLLLAKGSPDKILSHCTNAGQALSMAASAASQGYRVLALAWRQIRNDQDDTTQIGSLNFAGLALLQDAPRAEAALAVQECHQAGIRVIMITGDHAETALSIAKQIKIVPDTASDAHSNVLSGAGIEPLSPAELQEKVRSVNVFARVAPEHKLKIVSALRSNHLIVGMTGDGVNDAPALHAADIGIAMGSGSDIAREASAMIILDDNFATIVQAVRNGRIIVHNLQHILLYVLATSCGGICTIALSVLAGLPLPLMPAQLLWVNLVTDGTSTFPLAFEQEHGNVMQQKPRAYNAPLISKMIIQRIIIAGLMMMAGTVVLFIHCLHSGYDLAHARTMAFCTLALFQIWNVQNSRSANRSLFFTLTNRNKERIAPIPLRGNYLLTMIMSLAILLQIAAVHLPFMNIMLRTVPLNLWEWIYCMVMSASIIVIVELHKFIDCKLQKRN
jgi:Ca2+-transporting ATPase